MFDGLFCSVCFFIIYVAGRAYCFALRCAVFDATSWYAPRSGGRKAPRGLIPLGTPQDLPLSLSFGSYQKACWRLRVLRRRSQSPASYCKQTIVSHFIPCRASTCITRKTSASFMHLPTAVTTRGGGQNKSVCHANPSWACAYAPKMEDACESTSPDGSQKAVGR